MPKKSQHSDKISERNQKERIRSTGHHGNIAYEGREDSFRSVLGSIQDLERKRVEYFAKLATLIPTLSGSADAGYGDIEIPESRKFWERVLECLIVQRDWIGVWCLVSPGPEDEHGGPKQQNGSSKDELGGPKHRHGGRKEEQGRHRSTVRGKACSLPTGQIQVWEILWDLSDGDLREWGLMLVVCLLEKGSALESLSQDGREPLTISAVNTAIRTGSTDLLLYVLEKRPELNVDIDQPDDSGNSPLHLCVKCQCVELTETVVSTLLELGCCTSVVDAHQRLPIHYVSCDDPRHQLIAEAAQYAQPGLRGRVEQMKSRGDELFQGDRYEESLGWYRRAMVLAESVLDLKLELALLHSSCSCVYANLAVMQDQDADSVCQDTSQSPQALRKRKTLTLLLQMNKFLPISNSETEEDNQETSDAADNRQSCQYLEAQGDRECHVTVSNVEPPDRHMLIDSEQQGQEHVSQEEASSTESDVDSARVQLNLGRPQNVNQNYTDHQQWETVAIPPNSRIKKPKCIKLEVLDRDTMKEADSTQHNSNIDIQKKQNDQIQKQSQIDVENNGQNDAEPGSKKNRKDKVYRHEKKEKDNVKSQKQRNTDDTSVEGQKLEEKMRNQKECIDDQEHRKTFDQSQQETMDKTQCDQTSPKELILKEFSAHKDVQIEVTQEDLEARIPFVEASRTDQLVHELSVGMTTGDDTSSVAMDVVYETDNDKPPAWLTNPDDKHSTQLTYANDKHSTKLTNAAVKNSAQLTKDDKFSQLTNADDKPSAQLTKDDKPFAQLTNPDDKPSAQLTKDDKPAAQLTKDDEPFAQLTKDDKPFAQLTKDDKPAAQLTKDDKPSAQLTKNDKPFAQLTYADDKLCTQLTKDDKPSADLTDADDKPHQMTYVDKPDDNIVKPTTLFNTYCSPSQLIISDSPCLDLDEDVGKSSAKAANTDERATADVDDAEDSAEEEGEEEEEEGTLTGSSDCDTVVDKTEIIGKVKDLLQDERDLQNSHGQTFEMHDEKSNDKSQMINLSEPSESSNLDFVQGDTKMERTEGKGKRTLCLDNDATFSSTCAPELSTKKRSDHCYMVQSFSDLVKADPVEPKQITAGENSKPDVCEIKTNCEERKVMPDSTTAENLLQVSQIKHNESKGNKHKEGQTDKVDDAPIVETDDAPIVETDDVPIVKTDDVPIVKTDDVPIVKTDDTRILEIDDTRIEDQNLMIDENKNEVTKEHVQPAQLPNQAGKSKRRKKKKKSNTSRMPTRAMPVDEKTTTLSRNNSQEDSSSESTASNNKMAEAKTEKPREKMLIINQTVAECRRSILKIVKDPEPLAVRDTSRYHHPGSRMELIADAKETANVKYDSMESLDDELLVVDEDDLAAEIDVEAFDNTTWEVECTAKAWKHLREQSVPKTLKQKAVSIICDLASGNWKSVKRNKLFTEPNQVFETKLGDNVSLLWEVAIAFSGRCSESPGKRMEEDASGFAVEGGRIYTEVVRIWGVSFSDDDLDQLIEMIRRSHIRGQNCLITRHLQSLKSRKYEKQSKRRIPMQFTECSESGPRSTLFYPPASPSKTEYHILKFYIFSSALAGMILRNMMKKVDVPFKVTDREHAIIHLRPEAPILLLGRSGTGKTTCCLYRLWHNFISYWLTAQGQPFLPRADWCFSNTEDGKDDGGEDDDGDEGICEDGASGQENQPTSENWKDEDEDVDDNYGAYDHMHQVFVTKNPVLCAEVHKNFYELCRAHDETSDHIDKENDDVPHRLQDVDDYSFPLFLTSKQLLLMLDASLDPPHFFERNEDGGLAVRVEGWQEEDRSLIQLLGQDFEEESENPWYVEERDAIDDVAMDLPRPARQQKLDPRKQVTYNDFAEKVWPKIQKNMKVKYHPSLVWTEIMSFIKGSYEALCSPEGHLTETEYCEVGRSRAPNFSGNRDKVYELFRRYQHHLSQNMMFDEADLVFHIFKRLRSTEQLPWIIHQLYIDETQDFTQAELSVLMRISQCPNEMFLTGDTAQGIMKGISFRFCDLKTLFYHAKASLPPHMKQLLQEPKKVYQLTHSYRSHAGILNLASAVLELMVEFFPESFDRLKKDQGLFDGPAPVLLESCSIDDLLILLQGNNRKMSHIEFGAHQAILVVDQASKESIPEILSKHSIVLTIYESKGLEFDDVLLYNFFTDSEADKEWRVVTSYLDTCASRQHEHTDKGNLHTIDEEMLRRPNRPRPLIFDANQHKVLNSELKHLYTALTRARVNVWLFDKDEGKRAPMFEFFKVLKLVRSITGSEQSATEFDDMVFAMKSSPEDWVRRGDEMMTQFLYDVAAKCYEMGMDADKEVLAMAHSHAQNATRMKDKPRRMKDEFIFAADKFTQCGEPLKAAQCLQNAQEYELAAMMYQKLEKLQEAARMFQRASKLLAASECYEQLGQYHKAVHVLDRGEMYEYAIQCLKRYNTKLELETEDGGPVPRYLEDNKPRLSERDLYKKLAELLHKQRSREEMLQTLRHLPDDEQLQFLEDYKYLDEAAKLMLKNSQTHSDVAEMMLRHNKPLKALGYAKKGKDLEVLGKSHFRVALMQYSSMEAEGLKDEKYSALRKDTLGQLEEARHAFKKVGNSDSAGKVSYYLAYMKEKIWEAKSAYRFFKNVKPFPNEAGALESWNIVVESIKKHYINDCVNLIDAIETLLFVMKTLLGASSPEEKKRFRVYMEFYGLFEDEKDQGTLLVYPKQRPLCAEHDVIPNFYNKKENQKECVSRKREEVAIQICLHLTKYLHSWTSICTGWLQNLLACTTQCPSFIEGKAAEVGKPCENVNCSHIHREYSRTEFQEVYRLHFMVIKLDVVIQQGLKQVRKQGLKHTLITDLHKELDILGKKPREKYQSCFALFDFLFQYNKTHQGLVETRVLMHNPNYTKVKKHVLDFIDSIFQGTLEEMCRSSDNFVKASTYALFFQLKDNVKNIYLNIESQLEKDAALLQKERQNAFIVHAMRDGRDEFIVQVFGGVFHESLLLLRTNIEKSIFTYTKFVKYLGDRNKPEIFPRMDYFLFWHEIFATVALVTLLRLSPSGSQCILPENLLAMLSCLEKTEDSRSLQLGIQHMPQQQYTLKDLRRRMSHFIGILCGYRTSMNLLRYLYRMSVIRESYLHVERCLILALVFLSNIGNLVPSYLARPLLDSMKSFQLSSNAPMRLTDALAALQSVEETVGVVKVLKNLLSQRDLELKLCTWQWNEKSGVGIVQEILKHPEQFSVIVAKEDDGESKEDFPEWMDKDTETSEEQQEEEEDRTFAEEDLRKHREEQAQFEREELEDKSAKVLQRLFKRMLIVSRLEAGNLKERVGKQVVADMFKLYEVNKHWCGICWVSLQPESKVESDDTLEESSDDTMKEEAEHSFKSIANTLLANKDEVDNLQETHLSSEGHRQSENDFNSFKEVYNDYFLSTVPEIQSFIEDLRQRKQFLTNLELQLHLFVTMITTVNQITDKIFKESQWNLVHDLRAKLVPLTKHYKSALEEAAFHMNRYLMQQKEPHHIHRSHDQYNSQGNHHPIQQESFDARKPIEDKVCEKSVLDDQHQDIQGSSSLTTKPGLNLNAAPFVPAMAMPADKDDLEEEGPEEIVQVDFDPSGLHGMYPTRGPSVSIAPDQHHLNGPGTNYGHGGNYGAHGPPQGNYRGHQGNPGNYQGNPGNYHGYYQGDQGPQQGGFANDEVNARPAYEGPYRDHGNYHGHHRPPPGHQQGNQTFNPGYFDNHRGNPRPLYHGNPGHFQGHIRPPHGQQGHQRGHGHQQGHGHQRGQRHQTGHGGGHRGDNQRGHGGWNRGGHRGGNRGHPRPHIPPRMMQQRMEQFNQARSSSVL